MQLAKFGKSRAKQIGGDGCSFGLHDAHAWASCRRLPRRNVAAGDSEPFPVRGFRASTPRYATCPVSSMPAATKRMNHKQSKPLAWDWYRFCSSEDW